ncbi:cyclin-like protein [Alternaria alternata]|uniref:RNA polymerase II holoenzyme cyclin-like subunit n=1 Tax=Alternaria alternata TaxID=5599 RepID=A0A177DKD4_ALTAL|nr:cyclin-like protein [Alternaria alternata]OAG19660.1 cyclin-like protein [Alternaria alternata]
MQLTEDDLYRNSTQFRNWSFTAPQLAAQRLKINIQATERVKTNVARLRAQRGNDAVDNDTVGSGIDKENGSGTSGTNTPDGRMQSVTEINCLTAEEELKIVNEFCERAVALGNHYSFPLNVVSTCIQFLRRFYLYNSPMTYHVNNILRTIMFLATKVELFPIHVSQYAEGAGRNVTAEDVLAPEYIIVQSLRYNLDVRHPFRAIKAGHMEMLEMAHGKYQGPAQGLGSKEIQAKICSVPVKVGGPAMKMPEKKVEERIHNAYGVATNTLRTIAVLTDAYFLYTPSQIWLSAHLLADEPLTLFYLSLKVPTSNPVYDKLLSTLRKCASLISSHRLYVNNTLPAPEREARDAKHKAEIKTLMQKLKNCRDPDKADLVKLNQAQKRDAVQGDALEESKAKRRKLAREGYEKESDAFWGPELKKAE